MIIVTTFAGISYGGCVEEWTPLPADPNIQKQALARMLTEHNVNGQDVFLQVLEVTVDTTNHREPITDVETYEVNPPGYFAPETTTQEDEDFPTEEF